MPGPNIRMTNGPIILDGEIYHGRACTGGRIEDFILIAKDQEGIKYLWSKFMGIPLDPGRCYDVVIGSEQKVEPIDEA